MSTNQPPPRRIKRERKPLDELKRLLPAIFVSTIIVCFVALLVGLLAKPQKNAVIPYGPEVSKEQLIPYNGYYYENISGPAQYQQKRDHLDSPYFGMVDFYAASNNENFVILNRFKTYQQTSEYTAGCACAIMVTNYLGGETFNESYCGELSDTGSDTHTSATGVLGATPSNLEIAINRLEYTTTLNTAEFPFANYSEFASWVRENLENNEPIIVYYNNRLINNLDVLGHYSVIIGIDSMGTDDTYDDVLVFAEPYDTYDHRQDGYSVWNLETFYNLWATPVTEGSNNYAYTYIVVSKQVEK